MTDFHRSFLKWVDGFLGTEHDERSKGLGLMSSPVYPLSVIFTYLFVCLYCRITARPNANTNTSSAKATTTIGLKKLKILLVSFVVYNASVFFLSLALGLIFVWLIIKEGQYSYSLKCEKNVSKSDLMLARMLWLFFLSKIYELFDTFYLVAKKKFLSFLHVYHHSSIILASWIGVAYVPFLGTAIMALINSWVHVFMYLYYNLTAWGYKPSLTYKKFVTIIQIAQFLVTIVHCFVSLRTDCHFPPWVIYALLAYLVSFLALFINFYTETYLKSPKKEKEVKKE